MWHNFIPLAEKRLNLQPGQQPVNRKLGQPAEDVHVFTNKKRLLLAKETPGSDKDKYEKIVTFSLQNQSEVKQRLCSIYRYGFDWVEMLTEPGFVTPPISCFRHAPLCDTWASDVSVGMKVRIHEWNERQIKKRWLIDSISRSRLKILTPGKQQPTVIHNRIGWHRSSAWWVTRLCFATKASVMMIQKIFGSISQLKTSILLVGVLLKESRSSHHELFR